MPLKLETGAESTLPNGANLAGQIERILHSSTFRGSETLRNLLGYLCACAIEDPSKPIKVREIARSVFGRAEDFDSQTDSIVRVHAGRLRSKLAEYYFSEGAHEEWVVSIPKGGYSLACEFRRTTRAAVGEMVEAPVLPSEPELPAVIHTAAPRRGIPVWVVATAALILGAFAADLLRTVTEESRVPSSLRTFWKSFVTSAGSPVIVFSNLTLEDHGPPLANTYTTNGEVMGVFAISRMLSLLKKPARAKPGGLLTWDDAKDSDLVFVGGPLAETPLRDLALFKDFQFRQGGAGQAGSIVNVHPRKGEPASYIGDYSRPRQFDFGLIAFGAALDPKHQALALAGIDYYGTQAATEFVTRPDKMQDLLSSLKVTTGSPMPAFEALIYVRIHGGVPVQSEIVAVRRFNSRPK